MFIINDYVNLRVQTKVYKYNYCHHNYFNETCMLMHQHSEIYNQFPAHNYTNAYHMCICIAIQ